jgi:NAD(P)-dependent dehydrogenase (short-subunit alcohol dehydrogenase family)
VSERDYTEIFDLGGKTAVVTGGAGTLGREFAAALLQHGANVAVLDIDAGRTEAVAVALADRHGGRVLGLACDVAAPESVETAVRGVVERFGAVDVLLNNAAYVPADATRFYAPFEAYGLDEWRRVMAVNIDGLFLMAQAVGRRMVEQGRGGSIVQTSSIYGVMGADERIYEGSHFRGGAINCPAPYAASKAAVIGLTRWLATHWAEHGIRVNAIAPGGVEAGQNETFRRRYGARVPLGRMARAEEMVSTVLYLASDASGYVTGQCLMVDGGLSAW